MDSVFLLSGKVYDVEIKKDSLERNFAVTGMEQSECTLDYTMDQDIIGTFYSYTVKAYPKVEDLAMYDAFYDTVSNPNYMSHEVTFPYGQEILTFQAYITRGKDKFRIRRGKNIWGLDGLSLNFTAMESQRRR